MKTVPVQEAQARLGELIAEAWRGEFIVLSDGDKQVTLEPRLLGNLEEDNLELEAELLKAIDGPFAPYSSEELHTIGERVLKAKQSQ